MQVAPLASRPIEPRYRIVRVGKKPLIGITTPVRAHIGAILKADSIESSECVYNEWVATRLAQLIRAPIALGLLAKRDGSTVFASLQVIADEPTLPDVRRSQIYRIAQRYPYWVAGLVAFDLWVGNDDRAFNLKATLLGVSPPLLCGFDHSHALLNNDETVDLSIHRLKSGELIVGSHTFYGRVRYRYFTEWLKRIENISDASIAECCDAGQTINRVDHKTQNNLAGALIVRAKQLREIVNRHDQTVFPR